MKKATLIFIVFFTTFFTVNAQSWQWITPGDSAPVISNIKSAVDPWGNICIIGKVGAVCKFGDAVLSESKGIFVSKLNPHGQVIWARQMGISYNDFAGDIACDAYGSIAITGSIDNQVFVAKLDANGNQLWMVNGSQSYYSPTGTCITMDTAGNVIAGGKFGLTLSLGGLQIGSGIGSSYFFVTYISANGTVEWLKTSNQNTSVTLTDLKLTESGNYIYLLGSFSGNLAIDQVSVTSNLGAPPVSYTKLFVAKLNIGGTGQWIMTPPLVEQYGGDLTQTLAIDANDDVYFTASVPMPFNFAGQSIGPIQTYPDYLEALCKVSASGTPLWANGIIGDYGQPPVSTNNKNLLLTPQGIYTRASANYFYLPTNYSQQVTGSMNALAHWDTSGAFLGITHMNDDDVSVVSSITDDGDGHIIATANYITHACCADVGMHVLPNSNSQTNAWVGRYKFSRNTVTGQVYNDVNQNGTRDNNEPYMPEHPVKLNGTTTTSTDSGGRYVFSLDSGNYNINCVLPPYWQHTSPDTGHYLQLNNNGVLISGRNLGIAPVPGIKDARVTLTDMRRPRPQLPLLYTITYANDGTDTLNGTVVLQYGPDFQFISAVPAPTTQAQGAATWNYTQLTPLQQKNITLTLQLAPNVNIGSSTSLNVTINPISGDTTPYNNVDTLYAVAVNSYDPNIKEVMPEGDIYPSFIANNKELEYTIHFQNTGTDTAYDVVLLDTLSNLLDITTIRTIAESHTSTFRLLKPTIAEWTFRRIMLPDSATNEAGSQGFVKFICKPKNSMAINQSIKNNVDIFFDYNAPIKTNTVTTTLVIEPVTGIIEQDDMQIRVYPNPAGQYFTIAFDKPLQQDAKVSLRTVEGREIWVEEVPNITPGTTKTFNIGGLAKGIYFINTYNTSYSTTFKMVIK